MDTIAKVTLLSRIVTDLKKQVEELRAQQRLSTPPKVIEACQKTTSEAVDRIKEVEKLCKEAIGKVSVAWELLMEDEKVEKIAKGL